MTGVAFGTNRYFPRVQPTTGVTPVTGDALLAVPNIAALVALDDTTIDDGGVVSVKSMMDLWMLDKTSTLVPNGITVVAAPTAGNWVRMELPNETWQQRTTWYVDAITGDDENSGATVGTALATFAEFDRRVGDGLIGQVTVHIQSDLTEDIRLRTRVEPSSGLLTLQGQRTVLYSGTFSGATIMNPSANQDGQVTDAALPVSWTASGLVEHLCVITSGPRAGYAGWIVQDQGAKTARVSRFFNFSTFAFADPQAGDAFDIVDLTTVTGELNTLTTFSGAFFVDLQFSNPGARVVGAFGGDMFFFYCDIVGQTAQAWDAFTFDLYASRLSAESVIDQRTQSQLWGAYLQRGPRIAHGAELLVGEHTIAQASGLGPAGIRVAGDAVCRILSTGSYGVFDQPLTTDYALDVESAGDAVLRGYLWGTNNAFDYAILVESNAGVAYDVATLPLAQTAVIQDCLIGSIARAYGTLPFVQVTRMAGVVQL